MELTKYKDKLAGDYLKCYNFKCKGLLIDGYCSDLKCKRRKNK